MQIFAGTRHPTVKQDFLSFLLPGPSLSFLVYEKGRATHEESVSPFSSFFMNQKKTDRTEKVMLLTSHL